MRYALYLLIFREFSSSGNPARGSGEWPKRTSGAEENVPTVAVKVTAGNALRATDVTGKTDDLDEVVVGEAFEAATNSSPWREMDDFLARCQATGPITREEEAQLDKEFLEVLKRVNQRAVEMFKSAKAGAHAPHLRYLDP